MAHQVTLKFTFAVWDLCRLHTLENVAHVSYINNFNRIIERDWHFAFSALTLLVEWQEEHLVCKNWVMRCWFGYLSGAKCKWFACGPLMPLPFHHLLLHWNPEWFCLSGTGLPRLSWKKMPLNGCCCSYWKRSTSEGHTVKMYTETVVIFWMWCKIETLLLQATNRKWYVAYWIMPFSDDLELCSE